MSKYLSRVKIDIEPLTINICDPEDNRVYRHYVLGLDTINPEMITFLASLGVQVQSVEVFYTPRFMERSIHIDTPDGGDITRLNWVYCEGESRMHWYKQLEEGTLGNSNAEHPLLQFTKKQVELIHSETITNDTVIVHVGIPHNVQNLRYRRWALCFTISKLNRKARFSMEEAREVFKDYLID